MRHRIHNMVIILPLRSHPASSLLLDTMIVGMAIDITTRNMTNRAIIALAAIRATRRNMFAIRKSLAVSSNANVFGIGAANIAATCENVSAATATAGGSKFPSGAVAGRLKSIAPFLPLSAAP